MAMAVAALVNNDCIRIVLARPAVEAGEKLGFLPGDLAEKVNPYLRPLYDALHDMMDFEKATRLVQRGTIEWPPGLYAGPDPERLPGHPGRGPEYYVRADDDVPDPSGVRLQGGDYRGCDSDRPGPGARSGLVEARDLLTGVEGIAFVHFTERDVVRHPLVQDIIRAYEGRRNRRGEAEPPPA